MSDNSAVLDRYIVGVGASAGGLEALQKFLCALPADTGFSYILIQHLSPDYKSLLGEILSKYTKMPVVQAQDGMFVEPDCVYVTRPGINLRIAGGRLHLCAQREITRNHPIDVFFRSLAEEAGAHAIAVVLSGTGADGSNGIRDVKENDGMVIVQSPESAKFDGMPRSALRTGLVDVQLSPEQIAMGLSHIAASVAREPRKAARPVDEGRMQKIYAILKKVSNINFAYYKQSTLLRRIERRMLLTHTETLDAYVERLYGDPGEVRSLSREVLIGVTGFFRDPECFACLKETAIRNILLSGADDDAARVWVAGCSTGEEAYSVAILFLEEMEFLKCRRSVKIFATDLDTQAVTTASKGVYGANIADAVSPARLSRYFTRHNGVYAVNRDVRSMIVFSPHNIFQDPPFGRLDLICCRNLLIYFQPLLQSDIFAVFNSALKDGGYLFLGKTEAVSAYKDVFPAVNAAARVFSHRGGIKASGAQLIPYLQAVSVTDERPAAADTGVRAQPEIDSAEQSAIDVSLLELFMPACLILNEKDELVHTYGENVNYIHMPVGKFSSGLYDLLTEELKIPVSTLLKEARTKKRKVQYKDVRFRGERRESVAVLTALPISRRRGAAFYALILAEAGDRGALPDAASYDISRAAAQHIADLEQDLKEAQRMLNRSVSEQECVNEELQSANEELLTANEELQSSNEELQSVNEELYSVNSEYQQKLAELAGLNDDIANFLASTLIGVIFVDDKLNIRRCTEYVTREFSVMDHDVGRSLAFISYHFPMVDIPGICENVLATMIPDEREITTGKGKAFFMRVAPYRTTENKILGCVITLVDVTSQKEGQALLDMEQQRSSDKNEYIARIAAQFQTPMEEMAVLFRRARAQAGDPAALCASLDAMEERLRRITGIVRGVSATAEDARRDVDKWARMGYDKP